MFRILKITDYRHPVAESTRLAMLKMYRDKTFNTKKEATDFYWELLKKGSNQKIQMWEEIR